MLKIVVPAWEDYDPVKQEFRSGKATTLKMEHSLVSLSKWEARHCKPFLGREELTQEELLDYAQCMTHRSQEIDPEVFKHLTEANWKEILDYIHAPMTATTISNKQNRKMSREIITSEIIYYWMISLEIPMECQKWHLNRLLTLIDVVGIKNQPSKKMSKKDAAARYHSVNAARRAKHHSRG